MQDKAHALELAKSPPPHLLYEGDLCVLSGDWTLSALKPRLIMLRAKLLFHGHSAKAWNLSRVTRMDTFGALLLWRAWGLQEPESLILASQLHPAFERVRSVAGIQVEPARFDWLQPVEQLGRGVLATVAHCRAFATMLGMVSIEAARLFVEPRSIPMKEFSAALYKTGVQAMPISALVGFLIGIVLSYLSALQLRNFGADALIINILGIGIIRELGPVLVSILVAGRSGSAITAQLGVMRVTEEIDALAAMGVSIHQRLIWPKVLAMSIAMPLLVLWTSAAALAGGMLAAQLQLEIDWRFFALSLPHVVPVQNLYIGFAKGAVFGVAIALISCHFGLRIKPNTESLSRNTTAAVVTAITAVILLDAVFAMLTRGIGVPLR
ncbi:ABC transporter permease [Uliginosibacterium sp. 31-16]|uniref:MlaE family ABC transporter permease n=1 Tax=Uliginosibacterium sp. 31-16 TaxID=3068315 RepID=UPI00273F795E|nr:ABC transporter permease [Uliginosibacterium sp. 31-16]MDP5239437.1 ABC transporter permease [Uliginosibacterium sp. 31-16]